MSSNQSRWVFCFFFVFSGFREFPHTHVNSLTNNWGRPSADLWSSLSLELSPLCYSALSILMPDFLRLPAASFHFVETTRLFMILPHHIQSENSLQVVIWSCYSAQVLTLFVFCLPGNPIFQYPSLPDVWCENLKKIFLSIFVCFGYKGKSVLIIPLYLEVKSESIFGFEIWINVFSLVLTFALFAP